MGVYLSAPITEKVSTDQKCPKYTYGASSMQGWRMTQEDAHNCISNFDEETNTSYFAVYDGHGGSEVAQYTAEHLPEFIKQHELYKSGKIREALQKAFLGFDKTLTEETVIQELKTLAGVDDGDDNEVADDEGMGRTERDMLVAEANMPIEELMAKYNSAGPAQTRLGKSEKHQSPMIRSKQEAKRPGTSKEENGAKEGSSDALATNLDDKLDTEQPDNDNNLNVEKELRNSISDSGVEIDSASTTKDNTNSNNSIVSESKSSKTSIPNGETDVDSVESTGAKSADSCVTSSTSEKVDSETCGVSSSSGEPEAGGSGSRAGPSGSEAQAGDSGVSQSSSSGTSSKPEAGGSGLSKAGGSGMSTPGGSGTSKAGGSGTSKITSDGWVDQDSEDDSDDDDDDDDDEEFLEDSDDEDDEDDDDDEDEEDESGPGGLFAVRSVGAGEEDHVEEPGTDSGCTAVVTLISGDKVYVANAGDSRCVLCRDGKAVELSFDHKPEDEIERTRIEAAGGKVTNDGRVNGGLNLSRALGDHWYKRNETKDLKDQMISPLPDIETATLGPQDEFMVIACDGIWNSLTSQETVDFVREQLMEPENAAKPSLVCEQLFDKCLAPNTMGDGTGCDNMTCIIIVFKAPARSSKRPATEIDHGDREAEPAEKRARTDNETQQTDGGSGEMSVEQSEVDSSHQS
ncbi:probable protein phosphatase CG10417 [Mya arenaria]|uniref:probable protein phosphatase CG10417 n=1 Tax=Mya arenaria TaxID=6604 RepID=UPI0022E7C7A6|nr:probable protein phosphatase CG10417 [Mya arenaria]